MHASVADRAEARYWWIATKLMCDAAAVGNVELLPRDCWAALPHPDEALDDSGALVDGLAHPHPHPHPHADAGRLLGRPAPAPPA